MPTENFMSCSIKDSGQMDPQSFRTQRREHDGKSYNVLLGKKPGERSLTELTYNYPRDIWDESSMQSHCKAHGGHVKKAGMEDLTNKRRHRTCKYCGKRANKRVISKNGHVIPVDTECLGKAIHEMEQDGESDCHVVDIPNDRMYDEMGDAPIYQFTQKIRKVDSNKHQVAGPFIVPDEVDLQKQFMTGEEIREMIHDFVKHAFRMNIMHDDSLEPLVEGVSIVEIGALYNDCDYYGDGEILKKDTGVITVEIDNNPELWKKIESGEFSAFSIEGRGNLIEVPNATTT